MTVGVFPAQAGVVPSPSTLRRPDGCLPRASGGGPGTIRMLRHRARSSPRERGQSPLPRGLVGPGRLFLAQAGVVPRRCRVASSPAVLRDYAKSIRHYWHEASFISELDEADAAWAVASRLRDQDMAGGFVLRRFENVVSAEVRTWWVDGACQLAGPHPDTAQDMTTTELDLSDVEPLIATLRLPFVTADFALRSDGVWRLIERGDGQVSDRPSTISPDAMITVPRTTFHR